MESIQTLIRLPKSDDGWAPSFDPVAYEQSRVDSFNATPGTLTGYDCPLCKNKGIVMTLRPPEEGGGLLSIPCRCDTIRRSLRKLEASGMAESLERCRFSNFQARERWQQVLLDRAKAYCEDPRGWLVMLGQSGSGKTHLCTAVCYELIMQGHAVSYFPWREESARLKAVLSENRAQQTDVWKEAEILYIDDLFKTGRGADGSRNPTQADINLAFEILNYRYCRKLPTILSSEFHIEELLDMDEALAGRIRERAGKNLCLIRRDRSRNYRLRDLAEL